MTKITIQFMGDLERQAENGWLATAGDLAVHFSGGAQVQSKRNGLFEIEKNADLSSMASDVQTYAESGLNLRADQSEENDHHFTISSAITL